nr:hypothetical protein [Tanacetum cinerariifolium]
LRVSEEQRLIEEEEADELYRDIDINQGWGLQVSQDIKDSHVTLTPVQPDGQQESSLVSSFVTSMLNPISYAGQVKSQVKEQVSRILPRIEEFVNAQLEAEVLTRSSHSSRTSYAVAEDLTKMELKKILIKKMEGNKSIHRSDEQQNMYKALVDAYEVDKTILESYGDTAILKRRRGDDDDQEGPSAGSDRGSKRRRAGGEPESASTPSEPATRSASSLTELEYHLEGVYKATTDQLDWINPEGASSRKYTTSVTKTKAADYGYIKWIEDLVPRTMWIQESLNYDKYALWGVSHWGRKRQQFYGFAVNREFALDVYSMRRIIAVTELKIVEWHNYKHLGWILVHRDGDKI